MPLFDPAIFQTGAGTVVTVRDLITAALFDLGVLQAGEVPSAEDAEFAIDRFNDWVDALALESLSVYTVTRTTWPLTTAASYSVGIGGDVDIDRPVNPQWIQAIGFLDATSSPTQERLLGPPLTNDQYAAISQKGTTGPTPSRWYYNATPTLGTLTPWPRPTGSNLFGVLYAPVAISAVTALSQPLALPPGYRRFMRTNLAIELASAFGATVSPELAQAARDSKAAVKHGNVRLMDMPSTAWGFGGAPYDINTDTP